MKNLATRIMEAANGTGPVDQELQRDVRAFALANPDLDGSHGSVPKLKPLDAITMTINEVRKAIQTVRKEDDN